MHVFRGKVPLTENAAPLGRLPKFGDHVAAPLTTAAALGTPTHVHIARLPASADSGHLASLPTYSPHGSRAYPHPLGGLDIHVAEQHTRSGTTATIQSVDARAYDSGDGSDAKFALASIDDCSRVVLSWEQHAADRAVGGLGAGAHRSSSRAGAGDKHLSLTVRGQGGDTIARAPSRVRLHPSKEGHFACIRQWTNTLHIFDKDREVRTFNATQAPHAVAYVEIGPQDSTLVAVTEGGLLSIWDPKSKKPVMRDHYSATSLLALQSREGIITCAGRDRSVEAIEPRTWHVCGAWKSALKYDVGMVAMSPLTRGVCCAASGGDSEIAWGTWCAKPKHKVSRLASTSVFRADARWGGVAYLPQSEDVVGVTTTGHAYLFRSTRPHTEHEEKAEEKTEECGTRQDAGTQTKKTAHKEPAPSGEPLAKKAKEAAQ